MTCDERLCISCACVRCGARKAPQINDMEMKTRVGVRYDRTWERCEACKGKGESTQTGENFREYGACGTVNLRDYKRGSWISCED